MAYSKGTHAWGISDRSGFRYKLNEMKKEWTGALVGPDEWEPKHPQLGPFPRVSDPQALRNPRPDSTENVVVPPIDVLWELYGQDRIGDTGSTGSVPTTPVVIGGDAGIYATVELSGEYDEEPRMLLGDGFAVTTEDGGPAEISFSGNIEGVYQMGVEPAPKVVDLTDLNLQENDFVLLMMACDVNLSTLLYPSALPTGWTLKEDDAIVNNPGFLLCYKVMGATPDTSVSLALTAAEAGTRDVPYVIRAYRGVDTADPFDDYQSVGGSSGLPNAPAATASSADSARVLFGLLDDDSVEMTAPSGYDNVTTALTSAGVVEAGTNEACIVSCDKLPAGSVGSEDPDAFGSFTAATDFWHAIHVVLNKA